MTSFCEGAVPENGGLSVGIVWTKRNFSKIQEPLHLVVVFAGVADEIVERFVHGWTFDTEYMSFDGVRVRYSLLSWP